MTENQHFTNPVSGILFSKVNPETEEKISKILSEFQLLRFYPFITLADAVEIAGNNHKSYLLLLTLNSSETNVFMPQDKQMITNQQLFGLAFLRKDYGKVYIKPETFSDKFIDLFARGDIDFEDDPVFSKKYYVVARDKHQLRQNMSISFRQVMKKFDDLEIEIQGNHLLVRKDMSENQLNASDIAVFLTEINNGEN